MVVKKRHANLAVEDLSELALKLVNSNGLVNDLG